MLQITSSLDFLPWKWILWQKRVNARDVYSTAQGLKDLFPDPLIWRERQIKVGLARVDDISWRGWWRSGLALHSRPVFRDGFLLAYTMWCWNSCWVGSALSFPVGFSSNSKKWSPNWGPRNLQKECAHPNGWRDKHTHTRGSEHKSCTPWAEK